MNKQFTIGAALLLLGTGIVGCSNTAEGAKEDTKDAGAAVQKTGEQAATAVDNSAKAAADNVKQAADQTAVAAKDAGAAAQKGAEKAVAGTEAAAKDAGAAVQKTGEKVATGTAKAVEGAGKAVAGAGAAMTTTPMITTAIDNDAELSKPENAVINVDTIKGKNAVVLRGRVKTNEMKKKAETIAKKALADNKRTETVMNQLTVGIH